MTLIEHYRDKPFFFFFVAILVLILLSPVVEDHLYGGRFLRVLFTIMMATAVYAASSQRTALVVALCFAVPWLLLTWSGPISAGAALNPAANLLFVVFNLFVFAIVILRIARAEKIDLNILCGGLALYLLIAVNYAVTFALVENFIPGSFSAGSAPIPWHKYLYFSLTTLTTLGYGDLLPISPFARIWATMEAVTGVLYIAVLVARLVSLYKQ